jgi:aldehyde dehydrogenase (NAD+)
MSKTTPITVIDGHHKSLREGFRTGFTRPLKWRKEQIKAMARMIKENQKMFADALHADLNRSDFEGLGK